MEELGGSGVNCFSSTVRKKRSNFYRRPRPDPLEDSCETSLLSSIPALVNVSKVSSCESGGCDPGEQRVFGHNQCAVGVLSSNGSESETAWKKSKRDDGAFAVFDGFYRTGGSRGSNEQSKSDVDFKRCSEGVLAPANRNPKSHLDNEGNGESQSLGHSTGLMNENRLRKVKLKVGGVTRTIHAKSSFGVASGDGSSSFKSFFSPDAPGSQQKRILQDTVDDGHSSSKKVNGGLQGVPWKDFRGGSFSLRKEASSRTKISEGRASGNQAEMLDPLRKSKRVPKPRALDRSLDDGDEDEEIQYLEKLKHSRIITDYGTEFQDDEEEGSKKHRRISSVLRSRTSSGEYDDMDYDSSKVGRYGKQSRSKTISGDMEYMEEEEMASDSEPEARRKKQKKESVDSFLESKREMFITTRQRALQSGRDMFIGTGVSQIEFPNGLPPAPPRKQKEMLPEVEQQLKKAEAAQRRRMQVERAARESEAAAIRKILGQDSNVKKRDDKTKKRRDEIAQEKAANSMIHASNSVRWVMGPSGTVVIFPKDMDLPSIFDSKPCSYPPPREICAGPSCTNAYKYRDSKSKLPLCSLQCYRAIHEQMHPVSTC